MLKCELWVDEMEECLSMCKTGNKLFCTGAKYGCTVRQNPRLSKIGIKKTSPLWTGARCVRMVNQNPRLCKIGIKKKHPRCGQARDVGAW